MLTLVTTAGGYHFLRPKPPISRPSTSIFSRSAPSHEAPRARASAPKPANYEVDPATASLRLLHQLTYQKELTDPDISPFGRQYNLQVLAERLYPEGKLVDVSGKIVQPKNMLACLLDPGAYGYVNVKLIQGGDAPITAMEACEILTGFISKQIQYGNPLTPNDVRNLHVELSKVGGRVTLGDGKNRVVMETVAVGMDGPSYNATIYGVPKTDETAGKR